MGSVQGSAYSMEHWSKKGSTAHLVRDASPCRNPHRRLAVSLGRSVASRNGSRGTPTGVLERGIDLFTWSAQHRDMAGADTRRHVQCVCEQTRASSMKSQCAHSLGDFRRRQCLVRVAATHQRERNFGQPFLCALDLYSRAASSSRVDGASPARSHLAQVSVWVMTSTVLRYRLPEAIKELPADSVSLTASLRCSVSSECNSPTIDGPVSHLPSKFMRREHRTRPPEPTSRGTATRPSKDVCH